MNCNFVRYSARKDEMDKLTACIGGVLKAYREQHSMSLDEVARLTSVSKAMLGQIERGESNPTVLTLWKIASGLQVPFGSFLPDEDLASQKGIESLDSVITVLPLMKFRASTQSETLLITLAGNARYESCAHAKGVIEDILPINGEVRVYVGDVSLSVLPHQMVSFQADQNHIYENMSGQAIKFYNIIHYSVS